MSDAVPDDDAVGLLWAYRGRMEARAGVDRRDAVLATALVVAGQVDVLMPGLFSTNVVGPRWIVSLTYFVAAASVVLRRARPGIAFAVGIGALAAQALSVGTSEGNGSLFPALVLSYSVAAYGSRRTAIAALCAIPVAAGIREVLNPENTNAAEIFNGLGWDLTLIAAWLLGAFIRTRRQLLIELRQQAADAAEVAAAAERARVARELHDLLAHSLAVVVVQAEAAEEALVHRPEVAAESMRSIQRTGREALAEVRRLVGVLNDDDAMREPVPGAAAVDALVERVNAAGLLVELEVRGSIEALPAGPDLAIYRIVQESLTNVLKHAAATRAYVLIDRQAGQVSVEVVDDGHGAEGTPDAGNGRAMGHGLRGMQERVAALGGSFQSGRTDEGFAVRAVLPTEQST
jgi:signal transduction histidine kinase